MSKYSISDVYEGDCSFEQFVNQYNPHELAVGETYIDGDGHKYKIIYSDGHIAVGKSTHWIDKGISNSPQYSLYYTKNGFKYNDYKRPYYRLRKIKQ